MKRVHLAIAIGVGVLALAGMVETGTVSVLADIPLALAFTTRSIVKPRLG